MAVPKISPKDIGETVKHGYAEVKGHKWHYLDAPAQGSQRGTIFLIHGFPDLSLAWRYQIPLLTSLGLRCIALDCMGYGLTGSAPELSSFTFKSHADAIAAIASQLGVDRIILGGHDWGGMVVYRAAQWYPDLISHVFSVATPYSAPSPEFRNARELVEGGWPQFGYQLQFGSEDQQIEKAVGRDEGKVRKLLMGLYGGKPASGKAFMTPEKGVDLGMLEDGEEIKMTPLLDQQEMDYYTAQFTTTGLHGPCNWYRTRKLNWEEEKALISSGRTGIQQPTLFIQALYDNILKPGMSAGMEKSIPNLTRGEVKASHWALWHTPKETNEIIKNWVEGVVFGGKSKL